VEIVVLTQTKKISNTCFDVIEHEVHAEWIQVAVPSNGNNDKPSKKKLGAGPIFGIVLATIITLGVAAYAAYWFITKRHLNPFGNAYTSFGNSSTSASVAGGTSARSSSMVASAGYQQAPMNQA